MAEPHSAAGFLGVKYSALVAGFIGGVISLGFLRELDKLQMALAVLSGTACAGYLTPIAIPLIASAAGVEPSAEMENVAAFFLGLTAMNIVPGVIHLSEIFRRDPANALRGKDSPP